VLGGKLKIFFLSYKLVLIDIFPENRPTSYLQTTHHRLREKNSLTVEGYRPFFR
ncbi:uncharacterized protein PgNI_00972, partial [Pyricularia grisea]|uniref:Uncharacterized protein n=1 Tax=Pyricularia grisea TaxID=148305 RepID=A0A6P8BI29_PYRGI